MQEVEIIAFDVAMSASGLMQELARQKFRLANHEEVANWCSKNPDVRLPYNQWRLFVVSIMP
jgi:hypothetical protein